MAKLLPKEETERQNEFIERVFEINAAYEKYAFVDTYGCQQNESDSEVIRGMLTQMGYAMTDDEKSADVIIINSAPSASMPNTAFWAISARSFI